MSDYIQSVENYCTNNQFNQERFCHERVVPGMHLERNINHHRHFADGKDASYEEIESNLATPTSLSGLGAKKNDKTSDLDSILSEEANKVDQIYQYHRYVSSVNPLFYRLESDQEILSEQKRKKKRNESHNKIEKKRMSYINDKITELGNLLPEDAKKRANQRKGLILKETVNHIEQLLTELEIVETLENKVERIQEKVNNLSARIQQAELQMESNNGHFSKEKRKAMLTESHTDDSLENNPITNFDCYPGETLTEDFTLLSQAMALNGIGYSPTL